MLASAPHVQYYQVYSVGPTIKPLLHAGTSVKDNAKNFKNVATSLVHSTVALNYTQARYPSYQTKGGFLDTVFYKELQHFEQQFISSGPIDDGVLAEYEAFLKSFGLYDLLHQASRSSTGPR